MSRNPSFGPQGGSTGSAWGSVTKAWNFCVQTVGNGGQTDRETDRERERGSKQCIVMRNLCTPRHATATTQYACCPSSSLAASQGRPPGFRFLCNFLLGTGIMDGTLLGGNRRRRGLNDGHGGCSQPGPDPKGGGWGSTDPKMVLQNNGFCGRWRFCFRHTAGGIFFV